MKRIFLPSTGPADWQRLLAQPSKHWRMGYSAMSAAAAWEAAADKLPPEILRLLNGSEVPALKDLQLLAAVPEWKVDLPGGDRASQTDVMVWARNSAGLVIVGVEAKVDEPFGPTVGEKRAGISSGQQARIEFLERELGCVAAMADGIRYQLLHRTVSAILTARQFHASTAVMLVQSFSANGQWRGDFDAFSRSLFAEQISPSIFRVAQIEDLDVYLAWVQGERRFSEMDLQA